MCDIKEAQNLNTIRKVTTLSVFIIIFCLSLSIAFADTSSDVGSKSNVGKENVIEENSANGDVGKAKTDEEQSNDNINPKENHKSEVEDGDKDKSEPKEEEINPNKNGWKYENNFWYYYSKGIKGYGWLKYKGKWYYLDKSREDAPYAMLANTKKYIDGKPFYFDKSGVMETGWKLDDGRWYYINKSGYLGTGWLKSNGKWYFLDGSNKEFPGAMLYSQRRVIGNATYFFNNNGAMRTGWIKASEGWYYADSSSSTKWKKVKNKWYYMDPNNKTYPGLMLSDTWKKINGKWYYFLKSGRMAKGWLYEGGYWYHLKSSGAMEIGWVKTGGKWYYLYKSGRMAKNTSIDGYKLNSSGACETHYYKDYVIVYIKSQKLYYYKNSRLVLESNVVTGKNNGTPRGTFTFGSRGRNINLVGRDYVSFVNYWMPFLGYQYGLHDASWRSSGEFGGRTYMYNGSHGCVNMPYSKAKALYYKITPGKTKLIIK